MLSAVGVPHFLYPAKGYGDISLTLQLPKDLHMLRTADGGLL